MILLLQRVARAAVRVGGETVGEIGPGLLVFGCVEPGDGEGDVDEAAKKTVELRVFEDAAGKMNRDVAEAGGGILAVSQFTLGADLSRGRRPGFDGAARPDVARPLFERYVAGLKAYGIRGRGGAIRRDDGGRARERRPRDVRLADEAGRREREGR